MLLVDFHLREKEKQGPLIEPIKRNKRAAPMKYIWDFAPSSITITIIIFVIIIILTNPFGPNEREMEAKGGQ